MAPPPPSRSRSKSQGKLSGTGVTSRRLVLITILLIGLFYYFTTSGKKKFLLGEAVDGRTSSSSTLHGSTEDVASKKIDYVVTFVSLDRGMNGTMVEKLSRTRKGTTSDGFSSGNYGPGEMKNYRDFGELFWSLYSLFRYGGLCDQGVSSESIMTLTKETRERSCLIGRVFVVVSSLDEVPEWLRSIVSSPTLPLRSTQFEEFLWTKIRVTLHKTLIKRFLFDASTAGKKKPGHIRSISTALKKKFDGLKLYNSNLIEALIPYIPTLSQFFIYLNNDMVLTKETRISDWFHKVLVTDGKIVMGDSPVVPKVFYEHVPAGSKESGEKQHCVDKDFHCYTYEKIMRVVLGEDGYREVVKNSFKGGAAILPHTPRLFSKLRYQNLIVPFKEHLLQLFIKYAEASRGSSVGVQGSVLLGRNPEEDPWLQLMYIYQEAAAEGNLFPSSESTTERSNNDKAIDLTRKPNNNERKVRSRLERVQSFVSRELVLKQDGNEKRHIDGSFLQEDGRFLFFQIDSLQLMKELAFSDPLVLGANRNRLLSICLNDDLPDLVQPAPMSRKRSRVDTATKTKPYGMDVLSMCEPYLHVYSAGIDHLVAEDLVASGHGQERTVSDIQLLKRVRLVAAPDQMDLLDPMRGDTMFRSTAALYQLFFCRLFLE